MYIFLYILTEWQSKLVDHNEYNNLRHLNIGCYNVLFLYIFNIYIYILKIHIKTTVHIR